MSRILKVGLLVVVGIACLPAIWGAGRWVLPEFAGWLDVGEDPICATYVVILPGDETNRPVVAAAMIRSGLAREVLIPQNPESADVRDGITLPTAQISRLILEQRGIPLDRIVLLSSESRTTIDDALAVFAFLREHPEADEVAVVTSAFHTRRARFAFRTVFGGPGFGGPGFGGPGFGGSGVRVRLVSAPNPGFASESWWRSREGMSLILMEYLKLGFYYVRYGGVVFWTSLIVIVGVVVVVYRQWQRRRERAVIADAVTAVGVVSGSNQSGSHHVRL